MATEKKRSEKLELWQARLAANETAYEGELMQMDRREALYRGDHTITAMTRDDRDAKTPHLRNICKELVESQIDSTIPQPKVTARRQEDQPLAKLIEDMIRNELDRMPFEELNDMNSRTVPIQGGVGMLVEWDNSQRTHYSVGELVVSGIHPNQIIPQDGIYTGIEDMDYVFLKVPQTKEYIRKKYGVVVEDETESDPDVRGAAESAAEDMVTQCIAYYRNDNGGIGIYSWVNEQELEDIEDYQARRLERCKVCGEPVTVQDGEKVCASCGGTEFEEGSEDYEEIWNEIPRTFGEPIPGAQMQTATSDELDEMGLPIPVQQQVPTRIPYYKPDIFPVILQKNVSVFGKFLGGSDVDDVADHQNTTNRIHKLMVDKLIQSGSYTTLPNDATIKVDATIGKIIRVKNPADKASIDTFDLEGDVSQDAAYLQQIYEESRQLIGITDSFQGRTDSTATSGKAKEFAAAQSAGRLESKRTMRNAAFARLFEAMFKFRLAYTDEPMPVRSEDLHGNVIYSEFNRYDFLGKDAAGEWYWNDQFLFSCDTSAPLATNREAMWQETRLNLQSGAFGDPTSIETLILFWRKMEALHYPDASQTRMYLEDRLQKQIAAQQAQMQMQQAQLQAQAAQIEAQAKGQAAHDAAMQNAAARAQQNDERILADVAEQARQAAARDAAAGAGMK